MIRRLAACLLATACLALAGPTSSRGAESPRRFVYTGDADFAPYDFIDANGRATGFNVELVRALAKDAGVEVEIRLTDWNQARADLDEGKADLISLSYSEERGRTYAWLARTWAMHQCVLFRQRKDPYPATLTAMAGETIAVQERSAVAEALFALPRPRPAIIPVGTQAQALLLMKDGVATGVGGNSLSLNVAAARLGLAGLVELPVRSVPYGLVSARGRASELAWVGSSVARLRDAGTLEALAEKYLGVPEPTRSWRSYATWALSIIGTILLVSLLFQIGNHELRRRVKQRTRDLETALAQRETLSASLQTSEERYRAFLKLSSEGIARLELDVPLLTDHAKDDQTGHILSHARFAECNDAFAAMIGARPSDIVGRPSGAFGPEDILRREVRLFVGSDYRVVDRIIGLQRKRGRKRWLNVTAAGVIEDGRLIGIWLTQQDVTDRMEVEEDIRTRGRILEAVAFSAARLLQPGSWKEHVDEVLARLGGSVGAGCAYIFDNFQVEDELHCRVSHEWAVSGTPPLANFPLLNGFAWPEKGPVKLLLENRQAVATLVRDLPDAGRDMMSSVGLKSLLIVPIFVESHWWGLLGFGDFETEREWTRSEIEALRAAGATLGAALMRERVENAVRASEKKHRDIVDFAPSGIYQSRRDGTLISVNREFARLLGYDRAEDAMGLMLSRDMYFDPTDRERLIAAYEARGYGARIEVRLKKRNGEVFWAEMSAHSVKDESGHTLYFEGFVQDISTRKAAEDEVRASEERYRRLFEGNPLPMVLYDVDTIAFLAVNEAAVAQYGYSREEMLKLTLNDLAAPEDTGFEPFLKRRHAPRPDLVHVGIKPQLRKDGSTIEVDITSLGLSLGGRPARLLLNRDVTAERKAALEREQLGRAIERAADEWHRTFDSVDVALVILDSQALVTRLNRAARDLLGVEYSSILGTALLEVGLSEPWRTAADLAGNALHTRAAASARAFETLGRKTWDVAAYLAPAGQGGEERVIVTVRDVTRIAALQESLRHSETMSAMGSLVAGVAHEVRNPLFSISATVDALENELAGKAEYVELAELLRSQVGRLRQLMRDLLDYGKPPLLRKVAVNPREILKRALRACATLALERDVTLVEEVNDDAPFPSVDIGRMEQVIQNLLANAIQHSPRMSTVRVSARRCDDPDAPLELAVEDDGTGLVAGEIPHLFEPFFSRRKGGTGLGLSIVQRIVEAHGGRVAASNRNGGGAAFVVRLPAKDVETVEISHG